MKKISREQYDEMKAQDASLRIIPTRWVDIDKSHDPAQPKLKSRFVVRGDMEEASKMRTDSPTGRQIAMGLLLSYSASTSQPLEQETSRRPFFKDRNWTAAWC